MSAKQDGTRPAVKAQVAARFLKPQSCKSRSTNLIKWSLFGNYRTGSNATSETDARSFKSDAYLLCSHNESPARALRGSLCVDRVCLRANAIAVAQAAGCNAPTRVRTESAESDSCSGRAT